MLKQPMQCVFWILWSLAHDDKPVPKAKPNPIPRKIRTLDQDLLIEKNRDLTEVSDGEALVQDDVSFDLSAPFFLHSIQFMHGNFTSEKEVAGVLLF